MKKRTALFAILFAACGGELGQLEPSLVSNGYLSEVEEADFKVKLVSASQEALPLCGPIEQWCTDDDSGRCCLLEEETMQASFLSGPFCYDCPTRIPPEIPRSEVPRFRGVQLVRWAE